MSGWNRWKNSWHVQLIYILSVISNSWFSINFFHSCDEFTFFPDKITKNALFVVFLIRSKIFWCYANIDKKRLKKGFALCKPDEWQIHQMNFEFDSKSTIRKKPTKNHLTVHVTIFSTGFISSKIHSDN